MFIDTNKFSNIVKNWNNFLIRMENLKSYIIKFEKNDKMKLKINLFDCTIRKNN